MGEAMREAEKDTGLAYACWALIFLGLGGIHRIYLGRYVTGVIWALTGGLFLVGQAIDLFLIPAMVQRENRRRAW